MRNRNPLLLMALLMTTGATGLAVGLAGIALLAVGGVAVIISGRRI